MSPAIRARLLASMHAGRLVIVCGAGLSMAAPIAGRIAKSKDWMVANLRQKDLLVVGFWSDWLNTVLGTVLDGLAPLSVTVIDKANHIALKAKAPDLWAVAHAHNVNFAHVQQSGAEALDELRKAFSTNFLRAMLEAGRAAFEESTGVQCQSAWLEIPEFNSDVLYGLRRDAEGVPAGKPATHSSPGNCEILAACRT